MNRPLAVIGAGTLGRRIALMLATQGAEVRVFDTSAEQQTAAVAFVEAELPDLLGRLADASPGVVVASESLEEAVAGTWLVIEALPERLELKQQVFAELDRLAPADAVLATNSSSYPVSRVERRPSAALICIDRHSDRGRPVSPTARCEDRAADIGKADHRWHPPG